MKTNQDQRIFSALNHAITTLAGNPPILLPYITLAFIQLFILEIFFFSPQFPLSFIFGPIVRKLWGEQFLHYPVNFMLLPRIWQAIQTPFYIFVSSFFICLSLTALVAINEGQTVKKEDLRKKARGLYIQVLAAAFCAFLLLFLIFQLFELVQNRAVLIRATSGVTYLIKRIVLDGSAYWGLAISIVVTTIFAYIIPIIIADSRKFFPAFKAGLKMLGRSFWFTFGLIIVAYLCYVPIILLRQLSLVYTAMPDLTLLTLILSILVMIAIDAVVYTALTTFYLMQKENQ
ncbi:MAG: hypothetical protein HQL23_05710 [Candidatus Omnitrophica bacterium]|nr:hypothetical protein [Candidatus Omnitrophota bacterium]